MASITEEALRKRQAELKDEISKVEAVSGPLREARDAYSLEADAKLKDMAEKMHSAEASLFELKKEAGMIARALGGKSLNSSAR
jgi:hypothetical protein